MKFCKLFLSSDSELFSHGLFYTLEDCENMYRISPDSARKDENKIEITFHKELKVSSTIIITGIGLLDPKGEYLRYKKLEHSIKVFPEDSFNLYYNYSGTL